jgi:AraC-like DNA-binding protein
VARRSNQLANDSIVIARWPHLAGVEVKTIARAERLWRVLHENYAVVSPIIGASCRIFRGEAITRQPGELMLYAPGDFDANTYYEPGSAFHVVSIEPRVLDAVLRQASGQRDWRLRASAVASRPLAAAVSAFAGAMHRADSELAIDGAFVGLASELADHHLAHQRDRHARASTGEHRAIARLRARLHADLDHPPSLDELARDVNLDRFQVIRLFKAELGATPYAYRQALRIARARAMLRRGKWPSEVGAVLGFADFSHFRRTFVKYAGLSPNQYRRAI